MSHLFLGDLYWYWFIAAISFLVIELVVINSGFFLWLALAALLTGCITYFLALGGWFQCFIFAIIAIFLIFFSRKYLRKHLNKPPVDGLNQRSLQYVGRTFTLIKAIENGRGTIKVGDTTWIVSGPNLPLGTKVRVVGADGTILKVVPDEHW